MVETKENLQHDFQTFAKENLELKESINSQKNNLKDNIIKTKQLKEKLIKTQQTKKKFADETRNILEVLNSKSQER